MNRGDWEKSKSAPAFLGSRETEGIGMTLEGVSLYRGTQKTLEIPHLEIMKNSFTAVMGISGSGKTTLIECLSGQLRPQEGNIYVDGEPLQDRFQQHQRELAYVPQENIVHPEVTVRKALEFAAVLRLGNRALEEETKEKIDTLLRRLRIYQVRDHRVANLSGGQQKRVSVATEMVSSPRLLLLDEPTAGLDPGHHKEFMEMIREVADSGCTVVITTHQTERIEVTDRLVLIDRGEVLEEEKPEKVLEKNNCKTFGELFSLILSRQSTEEKEEKDLLESLLVPVYPLYMVIRGILFWAFILVRDFARVVFQALRAVIARPLKSVYFAVDHVLPRLFCLLNREQIVLFQHRAFLSYLLILPISIGVLIGVISNVHTQPPLTVFLALVASFWLGINTSALTVIREFSILDKERMASPYKETYVVAYLGSKLIWYGLLGLIAGLLVMGGTYLSGSIHFSSFGKSFRILMCIGLVEVAALIGVIIGLLISSVSENQVFAMALIPLIVLPGLLMSRAVLNRPVYEPVGTPEVKQTMATDTKGEDSIRAKERLLPALWYWAYRIHPISFLYEGAPLTLRLEPNSADQQKMDYLKGVVKYTLIPSILMGFLFFFLSHLVLVFRGRIGIGGR